MAIPHATSGEPIDVRPLGKSLPAAQTVALFKGEDLEVMRIVLAAGKAFPLHQVPGEITVHCLEGTFDIDVDGRSQVLAPGDLLYLAGGVPHALVALEDASALVTIALKTRA